MLKWINKKRNQKGFTLIELIVVIAILGILAAIAIPRFSGTRATANVGVVKSTLRNMDAAIQIVASEHNVEHTIIKDEDTIKIGEVDVKFEDLIMAQLGWTAYPTNSPKGVTYSVTDGKAGAVLDPDEIPWPTTAIDGLEGGGTVASPYTLIEE